jgi:hypothetical protein
MAQQRTKNLAEIVSEYSLDVQPAELKDILQAIRTLKNSSGWGRIRLEYIKKDLNGISVKISCKPTRETQTPV